MVKFSWAFLLTITIMCGSANAQTSSPPLTSSDAHTSIAIPLKLGHNGTLEPQELGTLAGITSGSFGCTQVERQRVIFYTTSIITKQRQL